MRATGILVFYVLISINIFSQKNDTIRALFIGNSYTYVNDLPGMTFSIANSMNDTLIYSVSAPGGHQLIQHVSNSTTQNYLKQGGWDRIVIQEQSQKPSFPDSQVALEVYPYAQQLNDTAKKYNPCSETVFYMTWGRKNGDASNCSFWPPVCTYEGMDDLLRQRYEIMADDNEAELSPVGAVWRYIRENYPSIELYSSDESHPSVAGTYAGACTFYTTFFKKDPTLISYNASLNSTDADIIKAAVKDVVFKNLVQWNIGIYVPTPSFTYNTINNGTVNFTNTSLYSDGYNWDLGDGQYSTDINPTHQYLTSNTYNIVLTAYDNCNVENDLTQQIDIIILSLADEKEVHLSVFPNPAKNKLYIDSNNNILSFELISTEGKIVQKGNIINNLINLNELPKGNYFIRLFDEKQIFEKAIIIE